MQKLMLYLFDVDGVLLHPKGYEQALVDTLDTLLTQMGLEPACLTHEEIAYFESRGITNEWLSGAIALSEYLRLIAAEYPEVIGDTFASTLVLIRQKTIHLPRPDLIKAMAEALDAAGPEIDEKPIAILNNIKLKTPAIAHHLQEEILADVRPPAPFADLFQNHTLGSAAFSETYGRSPYREIPGYLAEKDIPALNQHSLQIFDALLADQDRGAAIYTARPSLPPADLSVDERELVDFLEHPPEGDMVKTLTSLPESLPLISGGRMSWLAMRDGRHPGDYIKPSPVHGLATIAAAFSGKERDALLSASNLWNSGDGGKIFSALKKREIHVSVFEDSPSGIYAVRKAVAFLSDAGFTISGSAYGISNAPEKRARLIEVSDDVYDDVNQALLAVALL